MTREEFGKIATGLRAVYQIIGTQDAFDVWYSLLSDLDYKVASMATQAYMQTEHFPPTPADIRRYAESVTAPKTESMSEIEAWGLVQKAISNGNYGAEKEFNKLPKIIQETLGSPASIREMAQVNIEDGATVLASNFMRSYRAKLESHKHDMQLSEPLRTSIDQMRDDATPRLEAEPEVECIDVSDNPKWGNGFSDEIQAEIDNLLGRSVSA